MIAVNWLHKLLHLNFLTFWQGWEETIVKQDQSNEGQSEMKILLPSMPSLYITSFLFQACEEIQRVGGHVLDKPILKNFASRLLDKVLKNLSFTFSYMPLLIVERYGKQERTECPFLELFSAGINGP